MNAETLARLIGDAVIVTAGDECDSVAFRGVASCILASPAWAEHERALKAEAIEEALSKIDTYSAWGVADIGQDGGFAWVRVVDLRKATP